LEPRLQAEARRVLLAALDREALFTMVGPIKPWSTFGEVLAIPDQPESGGRSESDLADLRLIASALHCGEDLEGEVQLYTQSYNGVRFAEPYVLKRSSARRQISDSPDFFRRVGVDQDSSLQELLQKAEHSSRYDRFRAYGLLFGYPSLAVDFFVRAAEIEDLTGAFVARQFIGIPTFGSENGHFVWAVPVGHQETPEEAEIRTTARMILERYRSLRDKWIGSQGTSTAPRSLELIREWFHDGNGDYSPDHARF
jgi:hypothetical protein